MQTFEKKICIMIQYVANFCDNIITRLNSLCPLSQTCVEKKKKGHNHHLPVYYSIIIA